MELPNNSSGATSGMAVVMHNFEARYDDELSVKNGDSVKVVEILDENWAKCQNLGSNECGIVPQSFLQIFLDNDDIFAQTLPSFDSIPLSTVSSAPALVATGMREVSEGEQIPWNVEQNIGVASSEHLYDSTADSQIDVANAEFSSSESDKQKDSELSANQKEALTTEFPNNSSRATSGVAVVMHDFEARYDDELSVKNGDSVKVVEILDENWAKCQNLASNECGIVPQSFLQIFLDNDDIFAQTLPSFDSIPLSTVSSAPALVATGMQISSSNDMMREVSGGEREIPWNVDIMQNITAASSSKPLYDLTVDNQIENAKATISPSKSIKQNDSEKLKAAKKKSSIKLHPSLPLIQPFNVEQHTTGIADAKLQRDEAPRQPPRPPPPKTLQSTGFSPQKSIASSEIASSNNLPNDFQDQKLKIVQDLLLTETTYLFDLNSWEACITSSTSLSDEQKKILNNGIPHLKAFSKKLIDNIQVERGKLSDLQCYGQVFMEMREDFYRTFSYHCRSVELISQILDNIGHLLELKRDLVKTNGMTADVDMQESLNTCVNEMRKMGSNVFDVPTALSRPIHRCLKYPLYVGELLKNTPLNHVDHPKLMESLKQLGNLASKMNECKRRKELIRKYLDDQQLTLTERLSRISVHSLMKKSNRLKYRISSTMGLNTVRDSEFDYLISQLDGSERRVCKFLYCAQLYKKNVEVTFKKYEDSFKGPSPVEDERPLKILSVFLSELDAIRKDFLRNLETLVLEEGKKLVRCDYTKLVHKRCDKLADYEIAKATNKNSDEMEMRRNEYEALNNQVKSGLPKLISTINKKVVDLVHRIHEIDGKLLTAMDSLLFKHRQDKDGNALFTDAQMFSQFVLALLGGNRFNEINKVLRARTQNASTGSAANVDEQNSICGGDVALKVQGSRIVARRTASLKTKRNSKKAPPLVHKFSVLPTRQKTFVASSVRAQTVKERDALVKIMRAQSSDGVLRRVSTNFVDAHLRLNAGDVVIVKAQHKKGKCMCDNGVSIGYIPPEYLQPFDECNIIADTGPLLSPTLPFGGTNCRVAPNRANSRPSSNDLLSSFAGVPPSNNNNDHNDDCDILKHFRPVSLPALSGANCDINKQIDTSNGAKAKDNTANKSQQIILDNFDALFAAASDNSFGNKNFSVNATIGVGEKSVLEAPMRRRPAPAAPLTNNSSGSAPIAGQKKLATRERKLEDNLIDLDDDLIDLNSPQKTGNSTFWDMAGSTQPSSATIFPATPATYNDALKLVDYDREPTAANTKTKNAGDFKKWDFLFD